MDQIFPYANIAAGVLILIIGFILHWIGQLVSILKWDFAEKIGLQEKEAPQEYKVYEKGTAAADSVFGWVYGIAGIGLILGSPWGLKLAWIPGTIFIYHGLSYWFWTGNQIKDGRRLTSAALRIAWPLVNILSGALVIAVAWTGV